MKFITLLVILLLIISTNSFGLITQNDKASNTYLPFVEQLLGNSNEVIIMKTCSKCNIQKKLSEFSKFKHSIDGLQPTCKSCVGDYKKLYHHSRDGLIAVMYSTQKQRSKTKGFPPPNYTLGELRGWVKSLELFDILFNGWKFVSFDKNLVPSLDRKNDYEPYTLANLELTTWQKNNERGCSDRIKGINNKTNKAVLQFGLDSKFIKEYHSLAEAGRVMGVDYSCISGVCRGLRKTSCGYRWGFKNVQMA